MTDSAGNVAWEASYRAWGYAKSRISDAAREAKLNNPLRFQGQYFDDETGLHYNRFRYYDFSIGRFSSKDPIDVLGGWNLYAYGLNAISWIDPYGLEPGRATVFWHDNRSIENAYGHYSIKTEVDGRIVQTHQIGAPGETTEISRDLSGLPHPTKSTVLHLPDATAAQAFQDDRQKQCGGYYEIKSNSCVTHVGDVLRAGGVVVPREAGAQIKYLKRRGV